MLDQARLQRPSPRARAALALALLSLGLAACGAGAADAADAAAAVPPPPRPAELELAARRARADAATDALLARFWDASAGDFRHASPSTGEPAGYWISAIALEAVLDAAARTGAPRYLEVARAFVAAQDGRGWTRDWFDDEAWMALALLRAHDLTGERPFLERAAALVDDIARNAPDGSCCGVTPGGLWWDRPHTQKATASNAVTVIAAARLFGRTGEARWLDLARDVYAFWRDHMVDARTGQVVDHVLPGGELVWWRFSYDGGAMIGAALALHRATGDARYLADARRYAGFLLSAATRATSFGPVLFDGASCDGDCDAFKGITHRYLAALLEVAPDVPGLAALLAADADAAWAIARDPATGTFGEDWGAGPGATTSLAAQASAAIALGAQAAR